MNNDKRMKKIRICAVMAAAIVLTSCSNTSTKDKMEKCKVVKNGKGLIKKGKGDCGTSRNSCAGHNVIGDPDAWITVPQGQCAKINEGDFSGVDKNIKDKIDM